MTLTIGGVEIGGDNPCRFVAELSNNHNGSLARCLRLITAAKDAGADFIKTQCYSADELVALRGDGSAPEPWGSRGWTMRALYEKAATPFDWFPAIAEYCRDLEIPWFSSVFGPESLAVLEANGCPAYKIARLDNAQFDLLNIVEATSKPFLVSADSDESPRYYWSHHPDKTYLARVRDPSGPFSSPNQWFVQGDRLLFCPKGYPPALNTIHLPHFDDPDDYVYYLGLSSHCLDPDLPKIAVARGCKLIEMHFQLDDDPSELESNVSLTASQFKRMIEDVRRVEAMLA